MPPKLHVRSLAPLAERHARQAVYVCRRCQYATAVAATTLATTPAPTVAQMTGSATPISRHSTTQPASHRDPKLRKSQLLRSYVSLLQSTPVTILFQHNNLKATEWAMIRRELALALQKVDDQLVAQGANSTASLSDAIKLQVVQTRILEPALRVTEYYKPSISTTSSPNSTAPVPTTLPDEKMDPMLTHALSESAYRSAQAHRHVHPLTPLLTGSVALLNFPAVSPQHIKAALCILSPQPPTFPAPTRRANPAYHEPAVQDGLKKLMLLGARVDGEIFDMEGVRWIGGIDGGIDGLRAQLVAMLQGFGAGLAQTLEGASRSLWFTMEGRRKMLEEGAEQTPAEAPSS